MHHTRKALELPIARLLQVAALVLCSCVYASGVTAVENAESILEKADVIRFPKESFQVEVDVLSTSSSGDETRNKYRILSKGNSSTIVQTMEPASDRGQITLMKGRDLYLFLPSVSQPMRLSLAQRLIGQVSYGDLARANFTGDYTPSLLRTEKINGVDHHVLELLAVDRGVAYARVLFWVQVSNLHPYRAEFYSLSDKLLKTCRYENYKQMAGRMRPTRLVMEDALKAGERSVLEYSTMTLRDLPDKIFTKEYLKKVD